MSVIEESPEAGGPGANIWILMRLNDQLFDYINNVL